MATVEQIVVDGANGVTQAPRVVPFIPSWHVWSLAAAVLIGCFTRHRWVARRGVMLALCLSFVPGYWQVLVRRADAPVRQEELARTVEAIEAAYLAKAGAALAALPPGACFDPARDATCIPYGGLQDSMARHLGAARRCMGGEAHKIPLFVSACDATGLDVRLGP